MTTHPTTDHADGGTGRPTLPGCSSHSSDVQYVKPLASVAP